MNSKEHTKMDANYKTYKQDNAFGWQVDWPVFVKQPFFMFNKQWKAGEEFNWTDQPCRSEDFHNLQQKVMTLYNTNRLHHDSAREVQQKVGDRLGELTSEEVHTLIRKMNDILKKRCVTSKEFQDKRIKQSKILEKQRGILRSWINRNHWALEEYTTIRDDLLDRANNKYVVSEDN